MGPPPFHNEELDPPPPFHNEELDPHPHPLTRNVTNDNVSTVSEDTHEWYKKIQ